MIERLRESVAEVIRPERWRADQYYWFTAVLAARGLQAAASRLIALSAVVFGLVPLALVLSGQTAQSAVLQVASAAIAVAALGIAGMWLRDRWPSRIESLVAAAVGCVIVVAASLMAADPIFGLLGATLSVLLSIYIVCLHTARLLALAWVVLVMVLAILCLRLAETALALAVTTAALVFMLNVVVAWAFRLVISRQ